MDTLVYLACGMALGMIAAAPMVVQLRGTTKSLAHGIAAVGFAFLLIQTVLMVMYIVAPQGLASVGVTSVLCFLTVVTYAVLRFG